MPPDELSFAFKSFFDLLLSHLAARGLDLLRPILRDELRHALTEAMDCDAPAPLHKILRITSGAARKRLRKDHELAALGIKVGSRTLFRPSEVNALLARRRVGTKPGLRWVRKRP